MMMPKPRLDAIASPAIRRIREAFSSLKEAPDIPPDTLVEGYRVGLRIGNGGLSKVYSATGPGGRDVALKFPHSRGGGTISMGTASALLEREGRALSALEHPSVIRLLGSGTHQGRRYLALERVQGPTARRLLREEGPLRFDRYAERIAMVAEGLSAIHDQGMVHGDVKPGNMFFFRLGYEGQARLFDLGFVLFEGEDGHIGIGQGMARGTLEYMAPELLRGERPDRRSDIFSLGASIYRMLSGMRPFEGEGQYQTALAVLQHSPQPLSRMGSDPLPSAISPLIEAMMDKRPENRPQGASEIAKAIRSA